MSKEEKVFNYYRLCNKLKNIVRTGWKDWGVKRERVESVAEHIYGTQMLAIAMNSEYDYDIDIEKVLMMLAVHELEEIFIGDITQFKISREEKTKLGHEAVTKFLKDLDNSGNIKNLIFEFDERKSTESKFAYFCDKLECDLQCRLYDSEECVDLNNQESNDTSRDIRVKKMLDEGMSWSEMWMRFGQESYKYDDNFKAVSDYVLKRTL